MKIPVSDTGEIVLLASFSEKLGIRPGEPVDATLEPGRVIIKQPERKSFAGKIIEDPITGLPVLTAGPDAPVLTSEQVAETLADFP
jgi:hypothetical protein